MPGLVPGIHALAKKKAWMAGTSPAMTSKSSAVLTETAPAKINLTLRVIGRRADGYHELESLVVFADLADILTLRPGDCTALDVSGPFAAQSGIVSDNLVLKAVASLSQRVSGLKAGHFMLGKNIPVAAGIGGGSADAAAALRLLARANGIALDDPRLMDSARAVGADVPVCLASKSCIMRGVGEQLSPPLDLPRLAVVLVNPGVALSTRDVFAKFTGAQGRSTLGDVPRDPKALVTYLETHDNDLAAPAIACAPVIETVLAELYDAPGSLLARMSGSGATCFALFASAGEAAAAAWLVQNKHSEWWVAPATLG
jgi:4-diphosphocytidyl-2-C-methyl-D-erythritol kinase